MCKGVVHDAMHGAMSRGVYDPLKPLNMECSMYFSSSGHVMSQPALVLSSSEEQEPCCYEHCMAPIRLYMSDCEQSHPLYIETQT